MDIARDQEASSSARAGGDALRFWTSVTAAVVVVITLLTFLMPTARGERGLTVRRAAGATLRVTYVAPAGEAAAAGVRSGDTVIIDRSPIADRLSLYYPTVGRAAAFAIDGGGGTRWVRLVPRVQDPDRGAFFVVQRFLVVLYVLMAALVAWKAADRRLAVPIVAFLTGFALNHATYYLSTLVPSSELAYLLRDWLWSLTAILWLGGLLTFVAVFPAPITRFRSALLRAVPWIVGIYMLQAWWGYLGMAFPHLSFSVAAQDAATLFGLIVRSAIDIVAILAIADGWLSADRHARAVAYWCGGTLILFPIVAIGLNVLTLLHVERSGLLAQVDIFESAAGVGMTYAVLRHRLADLQLFISRAAIFSVVSIVLVLLFVSAEGLLLALFQRSLTFARGGSAAQLTSIAVALAVGLSAQRIHHVVEHRINRIFFYRRYRALEELHRLALDMDAATEADAVLDLAFNSLRYNLDASTITIYVGDPDRGYVALRDCGEMPPFLAPNEQIVVRLRRRTEPMSVEVDGHPFNRAYVCPMALRATLFGFVVCGRKIDRTSYLPDECLAIAELVHRVGIAYEWLTRANRDQPGVVASSLPDVAHAPEGFVGKQAEMRHRKRPSAGDRERAGVLNFPPPSSAAIPGEDG